MRAIFLLPTTFFALAGSAVAAEAPFAPLANQPDHVVTMVENDYRKKNADRKVTHHDDGIELWQKSVGDFSPNESTEATHVERRLVELDEARPSRALLTLDWWDRNVPAPTAPAISDHETAMEFLGSSAEPRKSIRITRRLGPWQFLEETSDGVLRSLHITHDSQQMRFDYSNSEPGAPKRLDITRAACAGNPATPEFGQPKAMNRSETILGETCGWFDMTPGMADTGRSACLTNDGIVLKEERYSRSGGGTWTAVRLTRRPVNLDEIKPPAALLEPQLWGID